jgi:hypothetical protein
MTRRSTEYRAIGTGIGAFCALGVVSSPRCPRRGARWFGRSPAAGGTSGLTSKIHGRPGSDTGWPVGAAAA